MDRGYGRSGARSTDYIYGSAAPAIYPDERQIPAPRSGSSNAPAQRRGSSAAPARRDQYQRGTAVKVSERSEQELLRDQKAALRNREKAGRMNPALILFMTSVLCVTAFILVRFIDLRASVTYSMKESNDETWNELNASIDLEQVKYEAIAKLGMTYAQEGQIVTYSAGTEDYVHQSRQIGE